MENKKTLIYIGIGFLLVVLIIGIFMLYNNSPKEDDINNIANENTKLDIEIISAELDTVNSIGYEDSDSNININNTDIELNLSLKNPGDIIIYNIELVNKGDTSGILSNDSTILKATGSDKVLENIEYYLTYSDGTDIKKGDELLKAKNGNNTITNLKLTVKYKEDGIQIEDGTNITLKAALIYEEK